MDVSADAVALVGSETSGTPDFEFKDLISVKTIGDLASLASGGSTGGNNGKAYGNNGKIRAKATEIREILIQMLVIMMKLSQHMMEM